MNTQTPDDEVDEWGEESFPASDPPSNTPRPQKADVADEEKPAGAPSAGGADSQGTDR